MQVFQHVLQVETFPVLNDDGLQVVSGDERLVSEINETTVVQEPGSLKLS